jgi:DNA topoisomerase-2
MAETYKKHTHREHILELPDTYIGSTETTNESRWVFDTVASKMSWQTVAFNPGLYKIFDEIIVNARDAFVRAQGDSTRTPVKHINVSVSQLHDSSSVGGVGSEGGCKIAVENDGDGIPIEEHPTEKCLVPELIFGHLLTSSNYNKNEEKIVGGKNGYGSKVSNIFSKEFVVEIKHPQSGKQYSQKWRNNMSVVEKASVKKCTSKTGLVRVELVPDVGRFKGAFDESGNIVGDMFSVLHTRTVELAAMVGNGVKVSWNGEVIPTNTFEKYCKLFIRDGSSGGMVYENCGERWEVAACMARHLYSEDEGLPEEKHISFVNGIYTKKGGKHVETVSKHILADFCELAKKKKVDIKPGQLKDSIVIFVNSTIVNPSFDSQTKEFLTTPATKFGSSPKFSGKLIDGLVKLGLLDEAKALLDARAMRDAKKTDGKKRSVLRGMPKLEDALCAGTAKSSECTLILTEGDSAAASAIAGLAIVGREKWGVFPLRGKLLNVKDITVQKFNANEELTAIKRILGLEHGKVYTDHKQLRYGRVMIMADQDHDGSHIKGLLMNLFHTEWASLLTSGFICTLLTPLLKASKGKEVLSFYYQAEFEQWLKARNNDTRGWHIKYYKGLGTSTPQEAREWFKNMQQVQYDWDNNSNESINLAFDKKRSDDRKKWLGEYNPQKIVVPVDGKVTYSSFIHDELIHFSNADNIRSLPHIIDGLKPSQRKILYCALKRNLRSEIKVAQLAGYVSENAAYHHGEMSLNSTIIGMAQTFIGSNNINVLKPIGQFGSRLLGGDDAASPRYIHTQLEHIVDTIFRKEDSILLKYLEDDGMKIEPEYYLPVVPLLAINGCVGIGTGFSTDIPPHKPSDIVTLIRSRLSGAIESLSGRALDPWWWGFKGTLSRSDTHTWITKGVYSFDDDKRTVTITELPIGTWTKNYKSFLDEVCSRSDKSPAAGEKDKKEKEKGKKEKKEGDEPVDETWGLRNFDDLYDDVNVKFVLYFNEEGYDNIKFNIPEFEKRFKLTTSWKTTNMCCFDSNFCIKRYSTIGDILEEFVEKRLPLYESRRQAQLAILKEEIRELLAKRSFIQAILDEKLVLSKKTDDEIVAQLKACKIPAISDETKADTVDGYDYVLKMRIDRLKKSSIDEMDKQIAGKRAEIDELEKKTAQSLWLSDLTDFENAWEKMSEVRKMEMTEHVDGGENGGTSGGTKKRVTKKSSK